MELTWCDISRCSVFVRDSRNKCKNGYQVVRCTCSHLNHISCKCQRKFIEEKRENFAEKCLVFSFAAQVRFHSFHCAVAIFSEQRSVNEWKKARVPLNRIIVMKIGKKIGETERNAK